MISAVILNWQRPYNLQSIMLPILEKCSLINEIIISHGRQDTMFDYESDKCRIVHRRDYGDNNREYGLALRFLACEDASNDIILLLDDDIVIPESSLRALCNEFARDLEVLHSLYGRSPDGELRYNDRMRFGEVTYAVCSTTLLPKRLTSLFFECVPLVAGSELENRWPFWGSEDLFMSLVAIKANQRLNRAHPFLRVELRTRGEGAPVAISDSTTHLAKRSRFSQLAIPALEVGGLVKTSPGYSFRHRLKVSLDGLLKRL